MGNLADRFGGKQPGELIQAKDWNGLIDGIEAIETALTARVTALETQVDSLGSRLGGIETTVDLLLGQARRVSLSTGRVRYAIGELAEITARVADARSNPLDLADEAARPWVDFVSSWGHLRPVSGFRSIAGTGDRTLSVQVNAQGEAKVLLRAEHAEGFTQEAETHVSTTLTTVLPASNSSVLTTILEASTPMEADLRGAFQVMTREYDRIDAVNVRDYVDTYFVRNPTRVIGKLPPITHETWRDYRSTVLAFLKGDSDPSTAEPGQGVCSIQVTFRDWIGPWLNLDYLPKAKDIAKDYGDFFKNNVGKDFPETTNKFKDRFAERIKDKGVIGRHRDYQAAYSALDDLSGQAGGPKFVGDAARSVKGAIGLQQTLESSEVTFGAPTEQVGLQALTLMAVQADEGASAAREEASRTREDQRKLREDLTREDGPISSLSKTVGTFSERIEKIDRSVTSKADQTFVTGLFNLPR
ncbi:MAG TPA: hypothetical protein VF756_11690 [Thermoanaerobaculia bacterium]